MPVIQISREERGNGKEMKFGDYGGSHVCRTTKKQNRTILQLYLCYRMNRGRHKSTREVGKVTACVFCSYKQQSQSSRNKDRENCILFLQLIILLKSLLQNISEPCALP
jgi:hypothetical protein